MLGALKFSSRVVIEWKRSIYRGVSYVLQCSYSYSMPGACAYCVVVVRDRCHGHPWDIADLLYSLLAPALARENCTEPPFSASSV